MRVAQDVRCAKFGFMQNVGTKIKVAPHLAAAIQRNLEGFRIDSETTKAGSGIPRNP